jgi:hypothetical protein
MLRVGFVAVAETKASFAIGFDEGIAVRASQLIPVEVENVPVAVGFGHDIAKLPDALHECRRAVRPLNNLIRGHQVLRTGVSPAHDDERSHAHVVHRGREPEMKAQTGEAVGRYASKASRRFLLKIREQRPSLRGLMTRGRCSAGD